MNIETTANIETITELFEQLQASKALSKKLADALRLEEQRVATELLAPIAKIGDRLVAKYLSGKSRDFEMATFEVEAYVGYFDEDDQTVEASFAARRVLRTGKLAKEREWIKPNKVLTVLKA